jgi:DNA-binding LacI/PurR family transcriptional regulator
VQDVARLAKVSVGSVSRVLNERDNVAPAIQQAVRAAVAELNFVPNMVTRSMRKGSSGAIGRVYPTSPSTQPRKWSALPKNACGRGVSKS